MVDEPGLAAHSPHQAAHHEVEPEDVQAQEPGNEGKQHVQHREVNIGAGVHLATVALSIETVDNVPREEPEAEVDPGDDHGSVNESLEVDVSDIDGQLEKGH